MYYVHYYNAMSELVLELACFPTLLSQSDYRATSYKWLFIPRPVSMIQDTWGLDIISMIRQTKTHLWMSLKLQYTVRLWLAMLALIQDINMANIVSTRSQPRNHVALTFGLMCDDVTMESIPWGVIRVVLI